MKKRMFACLLVVILAFSMLGATAYSQNSAEPRQEDGRLVITEPGSYVLQGKLTGCVYIDPGQGEIELILDGADIDGGNGAGIVAVSGERLTITLPEGSVNRVVDGGADGQFNAAIISRIDTVFEGSGALYVTGSFQNGICTEKADLTFNGGSYAIKAVQFGIGAKNLTINNGQFSIQAQSSFDPKAKLTINGGKIDEVSPSPAAVADPSTPEASTSSALPEMSEVQTTRPADAEPFQMLSESFDGQQLPEIPAESIDDQQPPEISSGSFDGQQPPEIPSGSFDGQQPPEIPAESTGSQQPQMPSDMQQPGQQSESSSADSPTEVVAGAMTNSAASLSADYDNATTITVTDDDSQVKITSSGTYVVTGSSSDGNITVKKGTSGVVLVLQDLDLTSTSGATVSVNKEAEVKIIISGTVTLTDNENPADENSADADVADAFDGAALKAKANSQVYVTGDGTLIIHGNAKNGIKAGDDSSLIFDGVTVNIDAVNDGINVNYDLTLLGGNFTIAAGDDAIHADHILSIGSLDGTGPTIRVTESTEGLEGTVVNIYGGDISIVSTDDAINAANGDGLYEGVLDYSFNMTGGRVTINSRGDGVDSNGNVNLIGGNMEIHSASQGGEAGIDYDGQYYISDAFQLNNQSGVAGPDGEPGQMGGMQPGQMGDQQPGQMSGVQPGQMDGQQQSGTGGMPGQMGGQQPGQMDGQPQPGMGGMSGNNPPEIPENS